MERLAQNNRLTETEKVDEVAKQFEAILLRQFLSEATKPMLSQDEGMNPAQKSIYQDMITNTLAKTISQSGEFGLAQAFRHQLMPRDSDKGEIKPKTEVIADE